MFYKSFMGSEFPVAHLAAGGVCGGESASGSKPSISHGALGRGFLRTAFVFPALRRTVPWFHPAGRDGEAFMIAGPAQCWHLEGLNM